MRELSLFSGAGGGLLGTVHLLGWTPVGYVEVDDYCQRVLRRGIDDGHLPSAPLFGDVRAFLSDGYAESYQGMVDVVTAGFPCQPFSVAGRRDGEGDDRNLWPETAECLRRVRPRFALLENVPGLLSAERVTLLVREAIRQESLFGSDDPESFAGRVRSRIVRAVAGSYFGQVVGELAEIGYDIRWDCIPASAVGAPHQRDRLWIVAARRALPDSECDILRLERERGLEQRGEPGATEPRDDGAASAVADADRQGQPQPEGAVGEEWRWAGDGRRAGAWWQIDPADLPDADQLHGHDARHGAGAVLGERSTEAGVFGGHHLADADHGQREPIGADGRMGRQLEPQDPEPCVADADGARLAQRQGKRGDARQERPASIGTGGQSGAVGNPNSAPPEPLAPGRGSRGAAREPNPWPAESRVGRVADGMAHRVDRLTALGNGQVPAVVAVAWALMGTQLTEDTLALSESQTGEESPS